MAKEESTPRDKLKQMLAFGTKLFAVPKVEYDEREEKRKKRTKRKPTSKKP